MKEKFNNSKNNLNMTKETTMSPIMKQYNELKEKHPEAFLLFRVGDFYEAYDEVQSRLARYSVSR